MVKKIGPRLPSGMFTKKRKPYTRKSMSRPAAKATTKLVKRVLRRELETKYTAEQVSLAGYTVKGKINPPVDAIRILPPVVIQTGNASSNVREGDMIEPIRARISGHIWYDNKETDVGNVIFVKLFFVSPKAQKSYQGTTSLTTLADGFLEAGAANPAQWTAALGDLQAFYPICKENYTLLKTKTFKFTKNGGLPIGNQVTHSTNIGKDRYPFSFSWKPPKLKYAHESDTYPQNHAPLMFAVAYSPGYNYDTDASLTGQILMNWQLSISFKDA